MPTPRQITRLTKQQDAELLEVAQRVARARAEVAAKIRAIARRARAATDAREREKLYAQIAKINSAVGNDLDAWAADMVDRQGLDWRRAAVEEIKGQTGRDPGIAVRLDRQKAQTYLRLIHPDNAQNLAAVFTEAMSREDIRSLRMAFLDVFRQAQVENKTANEIQKAIQGRWNELAGDIEFTRFVDRSGRTWENATYLQMLVRTTTARVARESYIDTLVENGDDLAMVANVGDSCPVCDAWGGLIISLTGADKRFPSYQQALDAGMYHPGCVVADTRVVAPGSVVAMNGHYRGDVIKLSFASGRQLTVTPNHMLLTDSGFAFAKSLRKGDNVFCCPVVDGVSSIIPDQDEVVPKIADVFHALRVSNSVTTCCVPATSEHLHGDGAFIEGNVHIVGADGLLQNDIDAATLESFGKGYFGCMNMQLPSLPSKSALAFLLESFDVATGRNVGSRRLQSARLWGHLRGANKTGLAVASDGDSLLVEPLANHDPTTAERLRECVLRFSGDVAFDQIVGVDVLSHDGPVFDVETMSSLYLANGIVSSNCDCLLSRIDATIHADEVARQAPGKPPKWEQDSKKRVITEKVIEYKDGFEKPTSDDRPPKPKVVGLSVFDAARKALSDVGEVRRAGGKVAVFSPKIVDHWERPQGGKNPKSKSDIEGRIDSLPWAKNTAEKPDAEILQANGKTSLLGYDGKKTIRVIVAKSGAVETWIPTSLFKQRRKWLELSQNR